MTVTDTINHVALVLDKSSSMGPHSKNLIKVADGLIKHLADQSVAMNQETRVSVYLFGYTVECVVFDKDVLRLPSIASLYRADGMTALVDGAHQAVLDLEKTAQMYGDHAFLVYVLTDGQENHSRTRPDTLRNKLQSLPENWTVAALVPDRSGQNYAQTYGFPQFNIAIWEANNSVTGIDDAMRTITTATNNYMTSRASGVRGTKNLFKIDSNVVSVNNLRSSDLKVSSNVKEIAVSSSQSGLQIRDVVEAATGLPYRKGSAYYQLTKREKVQPNKLLAIREKKTGKVYAGDSARHVLGLPDGYVEVVPASIADYDVFIQSTSVNRKVVAGTKILVL